MQTSLALFDRIFEYLDLPVEIDERADAASSPATLAATSRFEDVWFRYGEDAPWTLRDVDLDGPARHAHGDRRGDRRRARRRSATWSPACTTPERGRVTHRRGRRARR